MSESKGVVSNDQLHRMHDLLEEILEIQKSNIHPNEGMVRMQEIINESSKLVENSTCPTDIMVDAKILQVGSNVFNANVSSLSTSLTKFSEETYVGELLNLVDDWKQNRPGCKEGFEWEALAPYTYHLFRKSEPITFMLGPLSLKPLAEEETSSVKEKKKVERQKKNAQTERNVLTCVKETEEAEEEGSDIYEHILKCLVRQYRKNNKQPISYFNFILDPTDYWKTIENIFHFAFLVRDGNVKMSLLDGLPVVEPLLKKDEPRSSSKSKNSQFCLTLSMSDWREFIDKFQISSASILPFVGKAPKSLESIKAVPEKDEP